MSAQLKISPAHAMELAWRDWHNNLPDDDIPQPNPSFHKAWAIQQERIDELTRKMRVMQFAIHSAAEVIQHGTAEEMRETAGFLAAVKRITENHA